MSQMQVDHRYRNRKLTTHRVSSGAGVFTLGSARGADLRLLGAEVAGVHATLQCERGRWLLSDVGAPAGTWMNREAIVERDITSGSIVRIGEHELRFRQVKAPRKLFSSTGSATRAGSGWIYHQVIVRKNEQILETHLLPQNQAFIMQDGRKHLSLVAPSDFVWSGRDHRGLRIEQRLLRLEHKLPERGQGGAAEGFEILRANYRLAFGSLALVCALLALAIYLAPTAPNAKLQTVALDNPYSKLIYDAKLNKQLKKQSQQISKKMRDNKAAGSPGAGVPQVKSGEPKAAASEPKLATNKLASGFQSAGLKALVGKISKRAAQTAIVIHTEGVTADRQNSGPAAVSVSGLAKKAGVNGTSGAMGSYKIGAVGTAGKGGGQNLGSAIGGLGQQGVGTANVGFVEEEGIVEGGLDREVISKYIKTQIGQIRYCYERQLAASPELYGKVQVKFVIAATGAVSQQVIASTTLKNAMVEGCILRRIASWKFPEPKNGTPVLVTYPFLFKSTN